jgi:micrococcal nuclease
MVPRMRRSLDPLSLALTLLLLSCSAGRSSPSDVVPVAGVTDGDTIRVVRDGKEERVRLIGVDTPEVPWYGGEGECFGVQAALFARERLTGRSVRLVPDVDPEDRYGRLLAYVYLQGELFNRTLVRLGYGRALSVAPNTSRAAELSAAEEEARAAERGLWSACPAG